MKVELWDLDGVPERYMDIGADVPPPVVYAIRPRAMRLAASQITGPPELTDCLTPTVVYERIMIAGVPLYQSIPIYRERP